MRGDPVHKKMEERWQLLQYPSSQPAVNIYITKETEQQKMTDLQFQFLILPGAAQENKSRQAC